MSIMTPIDQAERTAALDLEHSIIVQAPAGSGKTELLCQRFLTALATVQQPEQVLAITFTRKAAEEMQTRIMQYVQDPQHALGQKVLAQDTKQHWQLLSHPERLSIMTIDGLSARIMDQAPIALALHGYQVTDDALSLYRSAVDLFFEDVDTAHPWQQAFHVLLLQCHNRWQSLHDLFVDMLAQREQWLMLLPEFNQPDQWRSHLENNLRDCVRYAIEACDQKLSVSQKQKLLSLLHFAGSHQSSWQPWLVRTKWPAPAVAEENLWRSVADFLLTQDNQFRKTVDKRLGFPVGTGDDKTYYKAQKEDMLTLLKEIADNEDLLVALQMMRQVPPSQYSPAQWQRVQCILTVLRALLAYFHLTIEKKKQIDFTEIALRAVLALGHEEMPSDFALTLDYRLRHILVDEFQDTSLLQCRLLERLTQSWQSDDGHSLFVVGDPLQSIYRFRQAEVGLFLRIWQQGFPHLPLRPIQLKQNFRAQENLITFYNTQLAQVLPKISQMYDGAVAYSPVCAAQPAWLSHPAVVATYTTDETECLMQLINHIQTLQSAHDSLTIGILVRARSHLLKIMPALRAAQINFQARDLSQLSEQPVVIDLLTWLKALLNLDDRLSWLAMLRAPCLGLSLQTLQQLFMENNDIVWQRLCSWQAAPSTLEPDQTTALHTVITAWQQARQQLQRLPLDQVLWSVWQKLRAAEYWSDALSLQSSEQFFMALRQFQQAGDLPDLLAFEHYLTQRVFSAQTQTMSIELMTIHKAKGLEFDIVLLPELQRGARREDNPLLLFDDVMLPSGAKFLLAPLHESTTEKDPIFNFLSTIQKKKAEHERLRLLYVACTRAKHALYFYAQLPKTEEGGVVKPKTGSFLADLWPISAF